MTRSFFVGKCQGNTWRFVKHNMSFFPKNDCTTKVSFGREASSGKSKHVYVSCINSSA